MTEVSRGSSPLVGEILGVTRDSGHVLALELEELLLLFVYLTELGYSDLMAADVY